jgi:hypothetical protein
MEALNTLERAKAPRAWRGRMPHSEGTMFCSRPITVDHVAKITLLGGGESSAIPSTARIYLH